MEQAQVRRPPGPVPEGSMAVLESLGETPIFIGAFGSGKTEIAINSALAFADLGEEVSLLDMDVVTPYFRAREARSALASRGVELIAPPLGDFTDLPVLPPHLARLAAGEGKRAILDVGGDTVGSRGLGSILALLPKDARAFLVVNPYRPLTDNPEKIASTCRDLERISRVKVQGLIANPHLGPATELENIVAGATVVGQAAAILEKPVVYLCVEAGLHRQLGEEPVSGIPVFPLRRYLLPPWEQCRDDVTPDGSPRNASGGASCKT